MASTNKRRRTWIDVSVPREIHLTGYWILVSLYIVTFVIDSNDVKNTYQSIIAVISKMIVSD